MTKKKLKEIRKKIGKPRRLSANFLRDERKKLFFFRSNANLCRSSSVLFFDLIFIYLFIYLFFFILLIFI